MLFPLFRLGLHQFRLDDLAHHFQVVRGANALGVRRSGARRGPRRRLLLLPRRQAALGQTAAGAVPVGRRSTARSSCQRTAGPGRRASGAKGCSRGGTAPGLAGLLQRLPQGGHLLLQQADLRLQRRSIHQSVNQTQRRQNVQTFLRSLCEIVFMLYAALSYQARRAPSFKSTPSSNNCKACGARRILAPGSPALCGQ